MLRSLVFGILLGIVLVIVGVYLVLFHRQRARSRYCPAHAF